MTTRGATYAGMTNQDVINAFFAVDEALLPRAFADWVSELVGAKGERRAQPYTGPRLEAVLGADGARVVAAWRPARLAGRGAWIKTLDGLPTSGAGGTPIDALLADAATARLSFLIAKLGHETAVVNDPSTLRELGVRLRRDLQAPLWGYHFVTGSRADDGPASVERQAALAAEWVYASGVQGLAVWVSDLEDGGWDEPWMPGADARERRARAYLRALRAALGDRFPLALCAPAVADRHAGIPYAAFLDGMAYALPRVYGYDLSPADEMAAAQAWPAAAPLPTLPVLRAFGGADFDAGSLASLVAAAEAAAGHGYSFFEWRLAVDDGLWPALVGRLPGVAYRDGAYLYLDGQTFNFIGVNLRELVHYGNHDIGLLQLTKEKHIGEQLDAARQLGGQVARVFLFHASYDPQRPSALAEAESFLAAHGTPPGAQPADPAERLLASLIARLENVLTIACGPRDALRPDPVRLLVAFTDFNDSSGFFPSGDRPFFRDGYLHDPAWYDGGWQAHYWPLVERVVRHFRGDPRIFGWEIGNELKLPDDPALFTRFAHTVARRLKQLDPFHLVGPGIISAAHCAFSDDQAAAFYAHPALDFATLHLAGDDFPPVAGPVVSGVDAVEARRRQYIQRDGGIAQSVGKPFIIEEAGYRDQREANLLSLLRYAAGLGGVGFMPWGFSAVDDLDIRVGDLMWGLDNFNPQEGAHFQAIAADFRAFAATGFATRSV